MTQQIEGQKANEFFRIIDELEKLLDDRISDLHEVRGGMQSRHTFCYYRKLLWEAKYIMRDNLHIIKEKK